MTHNADMQQQTAAQSMIDDAMSQDGNSIHPTTHSKSVRLDESNSGRFVTPVDIGTLLSEPDEVIPWVLEGYLAEGRLTLLAGPPKLGKTTLAYDAVTHIAAGEPFLGRAVSQGKVLVLGLEEHRSDIIARFRDDNSEGLEGLIKVQFPPFPYDTTVLRELETYIKREGIRLVLLDTLHAWWNLHDENDAAEVLRKGMPLVQCIHSTSAAWLSIVHTRKGSGVHGEEIRGSSALLGMVDISISMKRTQGAKEDRILEAVTRYRETPQELIVEYRDGEYVAIGDPQIASTESRAESLYDALTEEGQNLGQLSGKTGMSKQDISRGISLLGERVKREGKGVKCDPYRYSRNTIRPSTESKGVDVDETNPVDGLELNEVRDRGLEPFPDGITTNRN
jgi:hypothetical protein